MISSEVQGITSHGPNEIEFPSQSVPGNSSGSKKGSEDILQSLQITQSRMTEPFANKHDKFVMPTKGQTIKLCQTCVLWEEWASQSQQQVLKIQKKLIEKEKSLHAKFLTLTAELSNKTTILEKKWKQCEQEKQKDKRVIKELNYLIQQLKNQLKAQKQGTRGEGKSISPKNYSMSYIVQQDDDQNSQDLQTTKKKDKYPYQLQQNHKDFSNGHSEAKRNLQIQKVDKINILTPKTKEQNAGNQNNLQKQEGKKGQNLSLKRQLMLDFNSEGKKAQTIFSHQSSLSQLNYVKRDVQIQRDHNLHQQQALGLQFLSKIQRENMGIQKNDYNKINSLQVKEVIEQSYNRHLDLGTNLFDNQKKTQKVLIAENQAKNLQLKSNLYQLTSQKKEQKSLKQIQSRKLNLVKSKEFLEPEKTQKTIKLSNQHINVEKSRFGQTVTQCSFLNDGKSRASCKSYKLPIDEYTTVISHTDDHDGPCNRNPETAKTEHEEMELEKVEQMRRLQFENENLRSYNRVLLQKLSNTRPKKY